MVRNNSRCGHCGVRHLQTQSDSGMMSACCSWRVPCAPIKTQQPKDLSRPTWCAAQYPRVNRCEVVTLVVRAGHSSEIFKERKILENILLRFAVTTLTLAFGLASGGCALADELPAYMKVIVSPSTGSAADIATRDILQLNVTMFDLYGDAGKIFQKNIMAEHPVILALFSGAGGRLILYRPNMPPLEAPSVPLDYQWPTLITPGPGPTTLADFS